MTGHGYTGDGGGSDRLVARHVEELWCRMLQRDGVPDGARFTELGGDSLLLLSIMNDLEETYGVELDVDDVVEDLTVTGMARAVEEALGD